MRYTKLHIWIGCASLLLLLTGCIGQTKKLDRRVTLRRKDKIPYGTYVAYESLAQLFPKAAVTINRSSPMAMISGNEKKAYIIIVNHMTPDVSEWNGIMNLVGQGNQVFISAFRFGDSLLHDLKLQPASRNSLFDDGNRDSLQLSVYDPVSHDSQSFVYPGMNGDTYLSSIDSQYTTVLGRDHQGRPDFVRYTYKGGGALYLHFAPIAFTNFFLLHKNNMAYYDNVFSYLPYSAKEVVWDEYFRYDRKVDFSVFRFILSNRSLQWPFWLLLLLFLLIYLFESKRRQKMIPVIKGLRNTSLDFVRTVGHLYYQRRDNHNLALKMTAHFQDHVRTRYNLPVSVMDEAFVERLSYKTGFDKASLQGLVSDMNELQQRPSLTDADLLAFNRKMEDFYKQA